MTPAPCPAPPIRIGLGATQASEAQLGDRTRPPHCSGHTVGVEIADERHLVRAGVLHSLARVQRPRYEVVAEVADAAAMVTAAERRQPDLLITEIVLGDQSSADAIARCTQVRPGLAVVILTAHGDQSLVRDAIGAGALGYVLKDAEPGELLVALQLALRGASYLAPGLVARLADAQHEAQPLALTSREREVVRLIALGYTFPQIAVRMQFSERTVKKDRAKAGKVLGISSRVELTRWALEQGLVGVSEAA
jgi:two-component system, NarL family, response regulator NreC